MNNERKKASLQILLARAASPVSDATVWYWCAKTGQAGLKAAELGIAQAEIG